MNILIALDFGEMIPEAWLHTQGNVVAYFPIDSCLRHNINPEGGVKPLKSINTAESLSVIHIDRYRRDFSTDDRADRRLDAADKTQSFIAPGKLQSKREIKGIN